MRGEGRGFLHRAPYHHFQPNIADKPYELGILKPFTGNIVTWCGEIVTWSDKIEPMSGAVASLSGEIIAM